MSLSALPPSTEGAAEFVVELLDPDTRCTLDNVRLSVGDMRDLAEALAITDFEPSANYDLDPDALGTIAMQFGVRFPDGARSARLRQRLWVDDLPYRIHTNRELLLMLAGEKPLAVFHELHPSDPSTSSFPEPRYDEHVSEGRFVKRESIEPMMGGDGRELRIVLYALPTEVWGLDAYLLMMRTARRAGWNEGFVRMEGALLGYEDWQCDAFIEAARKQQK